MQYQFRPIERWPKDPTQNRQTSRFKSSYRETLKLLERELHHLRATNIVIQADCDESQIRLDGMLRSTARIGPRIILSFKCKHGDLSYPCDTYANWDCNIRAIALSLESLRKVDRYGVTSNSEQYRGWNKIAQPSDTIEFKTVKAAWEFIDDLIGPSQKDELARIREALTMAHPDSGGTTKRFKLVQAAKKRILDAKHN